MVYEKLISHIAKHFLFLLKENKHIISSSFLFLFSKEKVTVIKMKATTSLHRRVKNDNGGDAYHDIIKWKFYKK